MFGIKETDEGFAVMVQSENIFGTMWMPFITYNGTDDPFYFSTYGAAIEALKKEVVMNVENIY